MDFLDLLKAADHENWVAEIRSYIQQGKDINAQHPESGWTLLHAAAELWNYEALKLLIDNGAALNIQDNFGQTPLFIAIDSEIDGAIQSNREIMLIGTKMLLKAGADPGTINQHGVSPREMLRHYADDEI